MVFIRAERNAGRWLAALFSAWLVLGIPVTGRAQSRGSSPGDDAVFRAMRRIEDSVAVRAEAARVVLDGSRLLEEARRASGEGERRRALDALNEAGKAVSEASLPGQNYLAVFLMNLIQAERAKLAGKPSVAETPAVRPADFGSKLSRSTRMRFDEYAETLTRILAEEEVPVELLSVALVESGFNPHAISPKGARGIWQFMPTTARRYGLSTGPRNDRRTDPAHSTRAAAKYLRDLYEQFGDWKLALAAYNAGEGRIQRIIDRTCIRDFDEMARRGYLSKETRGYVPAVLGAWSRLRAGSEQPRKLQGARAVQKDPVTQATNAPVKDEAGKVAAGTPLPE